MLVVPSNNGEDSEDEIFCQTFRDLHLDEEVTFDPTHAEFYAFLKKIGYGKNLLHFLGYVDNTPVAYSGFAHCLCGCKRLDWIYLYVPIRYRKFGVALKFVRSVLTTLADLVGEDMQIAATVAERNGAMKQLMRYFGFETTHFKGVSTVGKVLKR